MNIPKNKYTGKIKFFSNWQKDSILFNISIKKVKYCFIFKQNIYIKLKNSNIYN